MKSSNDDETLDEKLFDIVDNSEDEFLFFAQSEKNFFITKAEGILFFTLFVVLNGFLAIYVCTH